MDMGPLEGIETLLTKIYQRYTSRDFDAKASSRRIENDYIIINIRKYKFN
jgi:hypothetical protein